VLDRGSQFVIFRLHDRMENDDREQMSTHSIEGAHNELHTSNNTDDRKTQRRDSGSHRRHHRRREYNDEDSTESAGQPKTSLRFSKAGESSTKSIRRSSKREGTGGGTDEDREMLTLNDFSISLQSILSQCGVVKAPEDDSSVSLRDEDFHWHGTLAVDAQSSFDSHSVDDNMPKSNTESPSFY